MWEDKALREKTDADEEQLRNLISARDLQESLGRLGIRKIEEDKEVPNFALVLIPGGKGTEHAKIVHLNNNEAYPSHPKLLLAEGVYGVTASNILSKTDEVLVEKHLRLVGEVRTSGGESSHLRIPQLLLPKLDNAFLIV